MCTCACIICSFVHSRRPRPIRQSTHSLDTNKFFSGRWANALSASPTNAPLSELGLSNACAVATHNHAIAWPTGQARRLPANHACFATCRAWVGWLPVRRWVDRVPAVRQAPSVSAPPHVRSHILPGTLETGTTVHTPWSRRSRTICAHAMSAVCARPAFMRKCICKRMRMCMCICMCMCACMCICMRCARVRMRVCACTCVHVSVRVRARVCVWRNA